MNFMKKIIVLNEQDNIGCALDDLAAAEMVRWSLNNVDYSQRTEESVPFGFKMALRAIGKGEKILKYGQVIGYASEDIKAGQCVHVHNVDGGRGRGDLENHAG